MTETDVELITQSKIQDFVFPQYFGTLLQDNCITIDGSVVIGQMKTILLHLLKLHGLFSINLFICMKILSALIASSLMELQCLMQCGVP